MEGGEEKRRDTTRRDVKRPEVEQQKLNTMKSGAKDNVSRVLDFVYLFIPRRVIPR